MSSSGSLQIEAGRTAMDAETDGCCLPGQIDFLADILSGGHTLRFRVSGRSMHPTIRSGDYVVLRKPGIEKLRMGDILLCRLPGSRMALHRLIAVFRDGNGNIRRLTTKGDGVDIPDPPMGAEMVLGRVTAIERHPSERMQRQRLDTPLFAGINLLLGVYHRIRSDVLCAYARIKADRWRRQGNDHAV